MVKIKCPKCNISSEIINGQCKNCDYNIFEFMKNNGLFEENRIITDKLYICPNCGTIDAGESSIRLKCYECGTPYKTTDINRRSYWEELGNACTNDCSNEYTHDLLERYVGNTINWDIFNKREGEWNKALEKKHEQDQQKHVEERARQDIQTIPKCPKCGSTAITAGQKGYSLLTGFLGSNKTVNRCVNCGHTWKLGR